MKKTVALVFGGRSPEHEVSIMSARNIYNAIDREAFEVQLIGISPSGSWYHISEDQFQTNNLDITLGQPLALLPGKATGALVYLKQSEQPLEADVIFPITHGPYGEDGSLQGLLRHLNLPFVGPDVLASAVSMDKDITKRLLREADLLVAEFLMFRDAEKEAVDYMGVVNHLGLPLFIKPANMGSSVGVSKATDVHSFRKAVEEAFKFDTKIIIEEAIEGREVECAVLGNSAIATTTVGEVIMKEGFYDFESKYESAEAAEVIIPARNIDDQMMAKLIQVAQQTYRVLNCEGMARVDMFVCEDGKVYVNEVNTLPGFTNISMYPQLWEHAGTSYTELISQLIGLALEKAEREHRLQRSRKG